MGRHKKYDRKDVLNKATGLFWQRGYQATSMADIVRVTGLNTASMYKEFGDKTGLFEGALQYYRENIMGPRIKILTDAPNIKGVEAFLASVVDGAVKETYRGCLMMNHLAQKNTISQEAMRLIDDYTTTMEGLVAKALRNAQADGDLPAGKDPAGLASYIMCCVHGMVLYGRHQEKKSGIRQIQDTILQVLRT
jgi:TetR/AcrR family transcriptional repressor of nem operon